MTAAKLTTVQTLDDSLIHQYRNQGFVKVESVITKEEAAHYREAALDASQRLDNHHGANIFTQNVNVWAQDEEMKKLTLHPNVGAIAQKLAGVDLRLWHDHILIKQPHNKAPTEFHQDQPFWPHDDSFHPVSAWIALCDVPVERGCMSFIPNTFRMNELDKQSTADSDVLFKLRPELAYEPRVTLPLKAGDATFHHGRCAHMANANETDDPRVAHVIIYMDKCTKYAGQGHIVTNPLNLEVGDPLDGEMFPTVQEMIERPQPATV